MPKQNYFVSLTQRSQAKQQELQQLPGSIHVPSRSSDNSPPLLAVSLQLSKSNMSDCPPPESLSLSTFPIRGGLRLALTGVDTTMDGWDRDDRECGEGIEWVVPRVAELEIESELS